MYEIQTNIDCSMIGECMNEDMAKAIKSENVKLINNSKEFGWDEVCFNYALGLDRNFIGSCANAYDILKNEYEQINIGRAKKGDIISYHIRWYTSRRAEKNSRDNAVHFAIIKKTKGTLKSTIIKSKWGNDGVFETNLYDVPDSYGNVILIWRKKGDIK